MDDYECEVCGKHLSGDCKIIIYSESPYWDDDEKHVFFCCNLHASKYIWAIAEKYGAYNPNPNYFFGQELLLSWKKKLMSIKLRKKKNKIAKMKKSFLTTMMMKMKTKRLFASNAAQS